MFEKVYLCEWRQGGVLESGDRSALGEVLPDTPFVQLLLLDCNALLEEDALYIRTKVASLSTEDIVNQSCLYHKDAQVRFPTPIASI